MKKSDLKKLALLGIAGGVLLSSEASASIVDNCENIHYLAQSNCSSCNVADNWNPGGGGAYYAPSASCNGAAPQAYYQPQAGCSQTAYDPRGNQSYGNQGWGGQWSAQDSSQQQQWGQQGRGSQYGSTATRNMSEDELTSQLNSQGKALYQSLSPEGKALALKLANQSCKGQNECKGLNACKGDNNSCAGRGSCAGTSPSAFTDKNQAVKVAALKMAEKRARMNRNY